MGIGGKFGHFVSEETKEKISKAMRGRDWLKGKDAPNYKGDGVCYGAKHIHVVKIKGKPLKCEHCGVENLRPRQYNWANVDHKYSRDPDDYIRLCVKCHRKYDYELFGSGNTGKWQIKKSSG
jgi:hypothetical protein